MLSAWCPKSRCLFKISRIFRDPLSLIFKHMMMMIKCKAWIDTIKLRSLENEEISRIDADQVRTLSSCVSINLAILNINVFFVPLFTSIKRKLCVELGQHRRQKKNCCFSRKWIRLLQNNRWPLEVKRSPRRYIEKRNGKKLSHTRQQIDDETFPIVLLFISLTVAFRRLSLSLEMGKTWSKKKKLSRLQEKRKVRISNFPHSLSARELNDGQRRAQTCTWETWNDDRSIVKI